MPADALSLRSVNTYYGESHVLHDFDLRLGEGRVLALLGRNGAGKTTALHSIVGFQPIRSGKIEVCGQSVVGCAPEDISRRGIALVPQGRRIFKSLTVQENLTVARRRGVKPRFDLEILYRWFPRLKERMLQAAGSLSGGEQQMLAIARALVSDPSVVLFDEPSEGLAPQIVEEVAAILRRLKEAGLSILLVEQNTKLALGLADDVTILNTGRLVFTGSTAAVAANPDLMDQHLGVHRPMRHVNIARPGGQISAVQLGSGPDLVILHSLLTDRRAFHDVAAALAVSHRVTLLDLPGFHGSTAVDGGLSAYVSWIREAFDGFGIQNPATLIGNGFGGTLALAFGLEHPDCVGRLAICDAAAGIPEEGKQAFRVMADMVAAGGMAAIAEVAANRVFHSEYLARNPEAVEERRSVLMAIDPAAFQAACRLMLDIDLLPRLHELKLPALVVCGALDQATPPALNRAVAAAISGARYVEIEGCGHCPPIENPQGFLAAFQTLGPIST